MLLATLGASLLGNLLSGKGLARAGEGIVRAGEGVKKNPEKFSLMPFQFNHKNEPRFNGVYSRNNLPKIIKKGAYVINLDEYANIGTHWIALFVKPKYIVYFDSFAVDHIPKEIKKFIGNKDIKTNIFRLQTYDSIMCGYFCIEFISYMFKGKTLLEYTNLFSPNDLKKKIKLLKAYLKNE